MAAPRYELNEARAGQYRMTEPNLIAKWSTWGPYLQSVLRVVSAFMFIQAGTMKLFAFPVGIPPRRRRG